MSYQRIYPNLDEDAQEEWKQLDFPRRSSWREQDEAEVLRDRNKVLKQYVEQANRIIEGLKRTNAKQRALLRQGRGKRPITRNLARELALGCLIGLFFFSLSKVLGF